MTRRFALHFAFAFNMSKITWTLLPEVETRGLGPQCRAGSRLSYFIYIIYRDQRIAAPLQARLCEPRSTADLRRIVLRGVLLTYLTFACASVELRHFPPLQKGGVPAAPSGTATLLRLSPNHQFCLRPILAVTDFRHPRLSWLDGRCVQGPGTYSPRHG